MRSIRSWLVVGSLVLCSTAAYLGGVIFRVKPDTPVLVSVPSAPEEARLEPISSGWRKILPAVSKPASPLPIPTSNPSVDQSSDGLVVPPETPGLTFVRQLLEESLYRYLPHLELSAQDYEDLAQAVLRVRAAHVAMGQLSVSMDHAEALQQVRQDMLEALADFETVTGFSLDEFTRMVQPDVGITEEDNDDAEVVFEHLATYPPPQ